MTFSQFLSILRARWKACLAMFFGTIAVVALLSLVLPKRYKAEGSVVVDVQQDPISAGFYGMMMNPAIVATQIAPSASTASESIRLAVSGETVDRRTTGRRAVIRPMAPVCP